MEYIQDPTNITNYYCKSKLLRQKVCPRKPLLTIIKTRLDTNLFVKIVIGNVILFSLIKTNPKTKLFQLIINFKTTRLEI